MYIHIIQIELLKSFKEIKKSVIHFYRITLLDK